MFWRIREAVSRFMYGRYGFDRMALGLAIIYLMMSVVRSAVWVFTRNVVADIVIQLLMLGLLGYAIFRVLSRNIERRRRELQRYTVVSTAVTNRIKVIFKNCTDRERKYMICPVCKAVIRFPRKRGVHPANCPKCRALITVKIR